MCIALTGPHCNRSDKTRTQEEDAVRDHEDEHPGLDTSRETCERRLYTCTQNHHIITVLKYLCVLQSSLAEWLSAIGLNQHYQTLVQNGYDNMDFISDITLEDLKEIGITKLGMCILLRL